MWPGTASSTWRGWGLLLPVIPLCTAGILTLQALGASDATGLFAPAAAKQLQFAAAGLVAMLALTWVGYRRLGRLSFLLFALSLVLLLWLAVDKWIDLPLVAERRGSRRWIFLPGAQLQPSELMKIAYVLALAWYLRYRRNYRTFGGLFAPFAITLVPMGLILVQPDLGTVLLFLPVLFAMLFVAGAKLRHLLVIALLGLMCLPVFWLKIRSYQRLRITGVVLQSPEIRDYFANRPEVWDKLRPRSENPNEWRRELADWEARAGYQLVHSKTAIGSGGIGGQGWSQGIFVEHDLLPENDNDFIFAMIGHQWGLLGCLFCILCYALIVAFGCDVATVTNDPFGRLLAVGLSTMLAVQTLTNLCMTVGLGPITGVTLPFMSAGGSSLVSSFVSIGLLISVARDRPILMKPHPFAFNEEAEKYGSARV